MKTKPSQRELDFLLGAFLDTEPSQLANKPSARIYEQLLEAILDHDYDPLPEPYVSESQKRKYENVGEYGMENPSAKDRLLAACLDRPLKQEERSGESEPPRTESAITQREKASDTLRLMTVV